jgi:hypothetical protein
LIDWNERERKRAKDDKGKGGSELEFILRRKKSIRDISPVLFFTFSYKRASRRVIVKRELGG